MFKAEIFKAKGNPGIIDLNISPEEAKDLEVKPTTQFPVADR